MQTSLSPSVCRAFLGCQIEKAVDELNLTKKIISCHPSNLPLPDHVDGFIAIYRSLPFNGEVYRAVGSWCHCSRRAKNLTGFAPSTSVNSSTRM